MSSTGENAAANFSRLCIIAISGPEMADLGGEVADLLITRLPGSGIREIDFSNQ